MPSTDPVSFARFSRYPHGWSPSAGPAPLALIDERHEHLSHCELASPRLHHLQHHPILSGAARPPLRRKRHSAGALSLQTTSTTTPSARSRLARSLTSPATPTTPPHSPSASADTMASPGSPPALSSSHSSDKSSSIASPRFHHDDSNDISNFEDISLADAPPAPSQAGTQRPQRSSAPVQQQQQQQQLQSRPSLRPTHMMRGPRAVKSTSNLRDASNGLRASVTLNNHVRSIEQRSPTLPNGRFPSNPRLGPPSRPSRRSASPTRGRDYRFGPMATPDAPALLRTQTELPVPHRPRRSPSQQRPRKSAAELEAEYDDLDEDLPDDVFMSNVPISPWCQGGRSGSTSPQHQLGAQSPDGSVDGSTPQRPRSWDDAMSSLSVEAKELSLKLETHATTLSRRNSAESNAPLSPKPPSPPRPGMSHSKTSPLPPVQSSNLMIDPLPASKEKEKHLARTRPSWLPPKNPKEEKKHLKEYQNMMHNFLESEKRKSADAEKASLSSKRSSKDVEAALRTWRAILGDWDNEIHKKNTRELWWQGVPAALRGQVWTRALGNDLQLNATGFKAALGRAQAAEERLSGTDRSHASMQARGHARNVSAAESRQDQRARRSLQALEEDIELGAFPSMGIFQKGQSRHRALRDLLLAYAAYREDTGHVRGTAGVAALLLLQFMPAYSGPPTTALRNSQIEEVAPKSPTPNRNSQSEKPLPTVPESSKACVAERPSAAEEAATASAFVLFANLLNRPLSLALCLNDAGAKSRTFSHIRKALRTKLPRLEQHVSTLTQQEDASGATEPLSWSEVGGLLCKSLLTSHLNVNDAARAWDVLVFEGDGVIVRGVVATLARLEPELYGSGGEVASLLSQAASAEGDAKARLPELGDDWVEWLRWAGREEGTMPARRR